MGETSFLWKLGVLVGAVTSQYEAIGALWASF
jgi:hypothetical protein